MNKLHSISVLIMILIMSLILSIGCTKTPRVLFTVPLCDCNYNEENPRDKCHGGYVCDSHSPCVNAHAQNDKCVPVMDLNKYYGIHK